jgi:hypothetical protein
MLSCFVVGEAKFPQQCGAPQKEPWYWTCSYEPCHELRVLPPLLFPQSCQYSSKAKYEITKGKKIGKDKNKSNSRANSANIIEGVEGTLIFRRRFFGRLFSRLGGAGIFDFVSLRLAPRRSGKRRRDGMARLRLLL